jgi:hypothetical protein
MTDLLFIIGAFAGHRTVGEDSTQPQPGELDETRPMRTRLWDSVGAGGEKLPATRLGKPQLRQRSQRISPAYLRNDTQLEHSDRR